MKLLEILNNFKNFQFPEVITSKETISIAGSGKLF